MIHIISVKLKLQTELCHKVIFLGGTLIRHIFPWETFDISVMDEKPDPSHATHGVQS